MLRRGEERNGPSVASILNVLERTEETHSSPLY